MPGVRLDDVPRRLLFGRRALHHDEAGQRVRPFRRGVYRLHPSRERLRLWQLLRVRPALRGEGVRSVGRVRLRLHRLVSDGKLLRRKQPCNAQWLLRLQCDDVPRGMLHRQRAMRERRRSQGVRIRRPDVRRLRIPGVQRHVHATGGARQILRSLRTALPTGASGNVYRRRLRRDLSRCRLLRPFLGNVRARPQRCDVPTPRLLRSIPMRGLLRLQHGLRRDMRHRKPADEMRQSRGAMRELRGARRDLRHDDRHLRGLHTDPVHRQELSDVRRRRWVRRSLHGRRRRHVRSGRSLRRQRQVQLHDAGPSDLHRWLDHLVHRRLLRSDELRRLRSAMPDRRRVLGWCLPMPAAQCALLLRLRRRRLHESRNGFQSLRELLHLLPRHAMQRRRLRELRIGNERLQWDVRESHDGQRKLRLVRQRLPRGCRMRQRTVSVRRRSIRLQRGLHRSHDGSPSLRLVPEFVPDGRRLSGRPMRLSGRRHALPRHVHEHRRRPGQLRHVRPRMLAGAHLLELSMPVR